MNLMNFMKILFLTMFAGTKKNEPARLYKKEESWLERNHDKIMVILTSIILILCLLIFIAICFLIGGTESGRYYNQLGNNI